MSTREMAIDLIKAMDDEQLSALINFIKSFARMDIPNEETMAVIHDIENGVGLSRSFSSIDELMEDIHADD